MISLNSRTGSKKRRAGLRAAVVVTALACVALGTGTAAAQDNPDAEETDAAAVQDSTDTEGADATSAQDDPDNPDVEQRLDTYWSADRDLATVQERTFSRDGRFTAGLYTGLMSSEPFFYYYPVGARLGYYFSNQLGIEVEGSFVDQSFLTHDTDLTNFLERSKETFHKVHHTEDRFLWRTHALATWQPFYGKLAFLQRKLTHFDFNLSAGAGVVSVERPHEQRDRSAEPTQPIVPEAVLGAGLQFFASQDIVVRADARAYVYKGATTPSNEDSFMKQLKTPFEFLLGANYMF